MPSVLDQILNADRARTAECGPFPLRGDSAVVLREARERIDRLAKRLATAKDAFGDDDGSVDRIEDELADAEADMEALLAEHPAFVVELREVLPPERVDALIAAHPPTAEQRKKAKAAGRGSLMFDEDTFPVAYIHATLVAIRVGEERQTGLGEEQVAQLWEKLSAPDRDLLFAKAWALRVSPTLIVGGMGKG